MQMQIYAVLFEEVVLCIAYRLLWITIVMAPKPPAFFDPDEESNEKNKERLSLPAWYSNIKGACVHRPVVRRYLMMNCFWANRGQR